MSTLAQKWDLFAAAVLPTDAGHVQRMETRRAFYAGAESMRDMLHDIDDSSEATAFAAFDAIQSEFDTFAADVAGGRA